MSFDQLVMQCGAPALCGIKSASLFSMKLDLYGNGSWKISEWNEYFASQGIHILPIQKKDGRMLLLVYNKEILKGITSDKAVSSYLRGKGYPVDNGFEAVFREFLFRLMAYKSFPHEAGVFLGYPLKDVIQFEINGGCGFKYCGYWKVYDDIESAVSLMDKYKKCSLFCTSLLQKGITVPLAACKYKTLYKVA